MAVAWVGCCCTPLLYDRPLTRSSQVLRPTAAILLSAGFLVVLLPFDAFGFRPVLARGWHGACLRQGLFASTPKPDAAAVSLGGRHLCCPPASSGRTCG